MHPRVSSVSSSQSCAISWGSYSSRKHHNARLLLQPGLTHLLTLTNNADVWIRMRVPRFWRTPQVLQTANIPTKRCVRPATGALVPSRPLSIEPAGGQTEVGLLEHRNFRPDLSENVGRHPSHRQSRSYGTLVNLGSGVGWFGQAPWPWSVRGSDCGCAVNFSARSCLVLCHHNGPLRVHLHGPTRSPSAAGSSVVRDLTSEVAV